MPSPADAAREDLRPFTVRVFIVVAAVLATVSLVAGVVFLADIAMLTFGAILIAATLRHGGAWIARRTGVSPFWGFLILATAILIAIGTLVALAGPHLASEIRNLGPTLSEAFADLRERARSVPWAEHAIERLEKSDFDPAVLGNGALPTVVGSLLSTANGLLVAFLVVFGASLFIGFDPEIYREPVVRLFPPNRRPRIRGVLDETGVVLARWFVTRLIAMAFDGLGVAIFLWWMGVPMPWLLGLITGLISFVPMIGSWLAIVPALIIASPQGIDAILWIILAYTIIQQIENTIVSPIVTQQVVQIPPAYMLLVQLAGGALVGAVGVAFAVPLLAAVAVVVNRLYVEDVLGDGEAATDSLAPSAPDSS